MGVDACVVDSGDRTDRVYAFCFPRLGRRIFAGKGIAGTRPICEPSRGKVRGGRLMLIGVDKIKSAIYDRLARGRALRFSDTLQAAYYEQLASERKVVRYVRGQPLRRFERKPGARAEALDCVVYAFAARHVVACDLDRRANELTQVLPPASTPTEVRSPWVSAW